MTAEQFNHRLLGLQQKMFSYALTLTANEEDAHDLVQETNFRALSSREKFVMNTNFSAWMHTIMRNSFINNYRRKYKMRQAPMLVDEVNYLSNKYYTVDTPDVIHYTGEIRTQMGKLEGEFKQPLTMHMEGYKYKEIAEQLEMPIGTVKSRIFFGRKKLQKMIELAID
ncbi:sigma-70 family RNA polymerase sigma factor [Carboxylicivirga marina]|uniref:Sigma-70 family RNA polymerase sigma factor n=1 Tax=Carboxylicivirga marina TaxID=2800988 RepID=A0ABS1HK18_9BACT|nr:sigma-70 family RNA polymerase sigma factor [Carboxylicivirga marina]MBK3517897.1 sigma-70 family RNA polymerase sigma factor [Carboxylicivirga marina]